MIFKCSFEECNFGCLTYSTWLHHITYHKLHRELVSKKFTNLQNIKDIPAPEFSFILTWEPPKKFTLKHGKPLAVVKTIAGLCPSAVLTALYIDDENAFMLVTLNGINSNQRKLLLTSPYPLEQFVINEFPRFRDRHWRDLRNGRLLHVIEDPWDHKYEELREKLREEDQVTFRYLWEADAEKSRVQETYQDIGREGVNENIPDSGITGGEELQTSQDISRTKNEMLEEKPVQQLATEEDEKAVTSSNKQLVAHDEQNIEQKGNTDVSLEADGKENPLPISNRFGEIDNTTWSPNNQNYKKMLENSVFADMNIVVKNGTRIPCHKSILAVQSEQMESLILKDLDRNGNLRMEDFNEFVVRSFLEYCYFKGLENPKQSMDTSLELLRIAKLYGILDLESDIFAILMDTNAEEISMESALKMFSLSKKDKNMKAIEEKSIKIMKSKKDELVTMETYKKQFKDNPQDAADLVYALLNR